MSGLQQQSHRQCAESTLHANDDEQESDRHAGVGPDALRLTSAQTNKPVMTAPSVVAK